MNYLIVIPARLESTRLPRKPLIDLMGKTMIQRTYEQVLKAAPNDRIVVATDSEEIANVITSLGYNAVMTSESCLTGTDRVAEVAQSSTYDYYINVQGDEPLINPDDIKLAIESIASYPNEVINGYASISEERDYFSRSIPKVVFDSKGKLLYMSRSPIPGNKEGVFTRNSWRQICIYTFPRSILLKFADQPTKSRFESSEDIEILRFVEMGEVVRMVEMSDNSIAVDNPDDVQRVITRIQG